MDTPLGQMMRAARHTAGLTLEDVAERVGVTVGALSHIESGRRLPSASNAMLIAEVLAIPAEDMLDALDREHSIKRESAARDSMRNRQSDVSESGTDDRAFLMPSPRGNSYSRRPIEDLFSTAPSEAAAACGHDLSAVTPQPPDARSSARWSSDTSERIEALDRLADSASEAIRTLRGLLDDDDPVVATEARRLLRELDVRMPEE